VNRAARVRLSHQIGNIHYRSGKKHICSRIHPFNASARRVFLFHGGIIVANQRTEEAAILFDVRVDQGWEAVRTKTINIRLVVLLVPRIIHEKSI
jgi:hypothetical protein